MKNAVFALLAAVGSIASARSDPVPETDNLKIRRSIEAEVQKVIAGANAADVDTTMASLSSSPDFRAVDNGAVYTSRDALVTAYRGGFAGLRSQDIRLMEQSTLVLAHDLAVSTARGTFTSTRKSGETTPVTPFAWTSVWRLESGAWKQLNVHQSFGPPAAAVSGCDTVLGSWEYVPPSDPGRIIISKRAEGTYLAVWILARAGQTADAGAWQATCEGARLRWRILHSADAAAVGTEHVQEWEAAGDTVRFWFLTPDGKRGQQGAARRLK